MGRPMVSDEFARITVVMLASMARYSAWWLCLGRLRVRRCLLCARLLPWPLLPRRSAFDVVYINVAIVLAVDTGVLWANPAVLQERCSAASIELQE